MTTSRNELPSLITRQQVSIEDNSKEAKELHQVFGSFIHLETDRNGQKPRIFDLSKKVIQSPRRHIVGETSIHPGKPQKLRWAPSNSYLDNIKSGSRVKSNLAMKG